MAKQTAATTTAPTTTAPAPAPAPAPAAGPVVGGVTLPLPTGPLYTANAKHPAWGKVQPDSHRAYAQAVATALASAMPKGFALNQYKAALVGNVLPVDHPQRAVLPPLHGWGKHNMPTWARGQGWLVPTQG